MKARLLTVCAILLVLASTASAQMTGSRIGRNAGAEDASDLVDVMVHCVASRRPNYALEVMRLLPGSQAEHAKINMNTPDLSICMDEDRELAVGNVELQLTSRTFRTRLARMLAQAELGRIDPSRLAEIPRWSLALYEPSDRAQGDQIQLGLYEFGDCVIAGQPVQAALLVQSQSGSDEATSALQALIPDLGPCLQDGVQLQLTPDLLVAALAEPIYHRAKAVADQAQARGSD